MPQFGMGLAQVSWAILMGPRYKRDLPSSEPATAAVPSNPPSVPTMKYHISDVTTASRGIDLKAVLIASGVIFGVLVLVAVIWTVLKCRRGVKGRKKMGGLEVVERRFEGLRGEWERISL